VSERVSATVIQPPNSTVNRGGKESGVWRQPPDSANRAIAAIIPF